MSSSPDTVFIMSSGHSGSTLLNLLIGAHPDAVAVGEVTHLPKNVALNTICSCGMPVRECGLWAGVIARMSGRLAADLTRDPYVMDLGYIGATHVVDRSVMTSGYRRLWKLRHLIAYAKLRSGLAPGLDGSRFARAITNTFSLFEEIRAASGTRLVVDASKDYVKGVGLYHHRPESTRIILLTRDGRAVFYSGLKRGQSRSAAIRRWRNYYTRALPLVERRVRPEHVLRLKYEEFAGETEAAIRRTCGFLGMQFDSRMLRLGTKVAHVANGNGMRLRGDRPISPDQAWRTELSSEDHAYFEQHAGALNRRLGYMDG
jgi:hypothetical protein